MRTSPMPISESNSSPVERFAYTAPPTILALPTHRQDHGAASAALAIVRAWLTRMILTTAG
jgi:hypothetical protein